MSIAVSATPRNNFSDKENLSFAHHEPASPRAGKPLPAHAALAEQVQNRLSAGDVDSHKSQQACASPRGLRLEPPSPAEPDPAELYRKEAQQFIDVKYDEERIETFIAARQINATIKEARAVCRYGQLFLTMSAGERTEMQALLDKYGVSHSPMCWPRSRLRLNIELEQCPLLGKGNVNKAYAIRLNGGDFVFKPFAEVEKLRPDYSPISLTGRVLGLRAATFHRDLRCMAAVRVADALNLSGPDGIVNYMEVAIVNGVPGILSRRVMGSIEGKGNLWSQLLRYDSPAGQYLSQALRAKCTSEAEALREMRKRGLVHIRFSPDGFLLTGTQGKRNLHASLRYSSDSYNRRELPLAQTFAKLINLVDLHSGNVMFERTGTKSWGVKLPDLDEAFAPVNPENHQCKDYAEEVALAAACLPLTVIPAEVRDALRSQRCRDMLANLRHELKKFLPAAELANFAANEIAIRDSALPDCSNVVAWKPGTELQPTSNLLHRLIGFSFNQDWDSSDSETEELDLPEAEDY